MPKLKFLVVEDDLFYQTYVNDLLAETGVDIINAADGETGLALAVSELPDLIITDIEIPKIQGFALFKKLREHPETGNIPVIMMSAKVEKALLDRHSALSVHAQGYLVKPFSGQVLVDMIRDIIGADFGFSDVKITPGDEGPPVGAEPPVMDDSPEISQFPHEDAHIRKEKTDITVLIVDDSRYICDITRDFLEELGISVENASDGESGYRVASELLPDLVLLDVQMPNMNGFVVCEMLRKQESTENIPIILMSAVVDDESFQRHSRLRYHADAYLQKPFMKSELHELVRRFTSLGNGAPGDIESKTGFFVPPEEERGSGEVPVPPSRHSDVKIAAELKGARAELEEMSKRESQIETELDRVRKENDRLEAEVHELRKAVEGTESGLQDKLTLVTQRFEEARSESERLAEENRSLNARLEESSRDESERARVEELERKLVEAREELGSLADENKGLRDQLRESGSNQELKDQLTELGSRFQEANASVLDMENRNKLLEKEVGQLQEKVLSEEAYALEAGDREKLQKEIEALKRDLAAATAAKSEIEDQARSLIENREKSDEAELVRQELERSRVENQELRNRISEAEKKAKRFDEVQSQLEKARSDSENLLKQLEAVPENTNAEIQTLEDKLAAALERCRFLEEKDDGLSAKLGETENLISHNAELEKAAGELEKEIDQSRKLAAEETQARMNLEGQIANQAEEMALLKGELDHARNRLDECERNDGRIAELENRLEEEKRRRAAADTEIMDLKARIEDHASGNEKVHELENDNRELTIALRKSSERCEQLDREAARQKASRNSQSTDADDDPAQWDERFAKLEDALGTTVREAQTVIIEQKDRQSVLEESVESLMKSLEEERSAYRKDRQTWGAKEEELREAFEDALRESRRLMGEEAARLYPMHLPRGKRPLEMVTRTSRYGIAAAAIFAVLLLFAGGYLASSKLGSTTAQTAIPVQAQSSSADLREPAAAPPEPWIARSDSYEDIWRQNTVQSVSDDMMIQATFHTRKELEAAIQYTAGKEGWTRERIQKAMVDMNKTYDLSGSYYITVYIKNLKSGYPGYADSFEKHISLRDHLGREVRAQFPRELEGSKFLTSRISAAGKEMNPVLLYEVGLTLAFSRKELAEKPEGLQLVLYDIGAVPMRVLSWDMSVMGSAFYQGPAGKPMTHS